jgi:hypothetical protein
MAQAAHDTADEMQGFKAAYIQSDEASFLLTDYDTLQTEPWLGYVQSKMESITASMFTAWFNLDMHETGVSAEPAFFDARAFSIPREEVVNYFLWRAQDWERNSLSMYCRSFFSDNIMHGKGRADQHELLRGIGKNWATDLSHRQKNGTWIVGSDTRFDVLPTYQAIDRLLHREVWCDEDDPVDAPLSRTGRCITCHKCGQVWIQATDAVFIALCPNCGTMWWEKRP